MRDLLGPTQAGRPREADRDDLGAPRGRSPQLLPVSDAAAAYRLVYGRVDALIRGRAEVAELNKCRPARLDHPPDGCSPQPGVAQDIVSLNLEEKGTDSGPGRRSIASAIHSIDELLDLWGQMIDPVTATLALAPQASACQLVFYTLTHEHDIRGALSEPGPRTGDLAFEAALGFATTMADRFIRHAWLPSLRLITPTIGSVQLGDAHSARAQVALEISDFEALRTFGGRRSIRQLLALPWHGDPTHLLPAFTHLLPAFTNDGIRPPNDDLALMIENSRPRRTPPRLRGDIR